MQLDRLNQKTAAELLGVTARTLREWRDAPRNADGTYPAPALVAWFAARGRGLELDPVQERARRDKETADKIAMENAVRRGGLAEIDDVEREWSQLLANARTRLLAMPTKLAPLLVNIATASVIAEAIKVEVYAALTELAGYDSTAGNRQ